MPINWRIQQSNFQFAFLAASMSDRIELAPIFVSADVQEIIQAEAQATKAYIGEYFKRNPPTPELLYQLVEERSIQRELHARQQQAVAATDQLQAARAEHGDLLDGRVGGAALDAAETRLRSVGAEVNAASVRLAECRALLDDCRKTLDGLLAPALAFAARRHSEVSAAAKVELARVASEALTQLRIAEGAAMKLRLSGSGQALAIQALTPMIPQPSQEGVG